MSRAVQGAFYLTWAVGDRAFNLRDAKNAVTQVSYGCSFAKKFLAREIMEKIAKSSVDGDAKATKC